MLRKLAQAFGLIKEEASIMVIGLDHSGKSCIINQLKKGAAKKGSAESKAADAFEATPTVGFQTEEFAKNNIKFQVYDMSGQSRYRNLWETYYKDAQAIIFVVDSSDKFRVAVAKEELDMLMSHPDVVSNPVPLLVYANKMDISGALSTFQCVEDLELEDKIKDRPWHLVSTNAVTGKGIENGIVWLCNTLRTSRRAAGK
jgi:ADP-ribosylation factor-like protein 6